MNFIYLLVTTLALALSGISYGATNVIEKQLEEIGSVPNDEVVVVQRKYTRKVWRHELTPITFGGVPFGTVRRTLFGGASYTLHANDWLGIEAFNFLYSKTFFSSFTDDINNNKASGSNQPDIKPDYQKLLYLLTTGVQITPFYGKMSTFSRWIAYVEPYFTARVGYAKTETEGYLAYAPGIGLRTFFKEWFSMKVEFSDYIYSQTQPTNELTNNFAVMVAFSFWLPKMPR